MKYRLTPLQKQHIVQFGRTKYAEFLAELLFEREKQLNEQFRRALPENFLEVKGRALEIEALLEALKTKESSGE